LLFVLCFVLFCVVCVGVEKGRRRRRREK